VGLKLQAYRLEGKSDKDIWDRLVGIELVEAARAHILLFTFVNFYQEIVGNNYLSENAKSILRKLCRLFAIAKINEKPNGLIESGFVTPN